MKDDPPKLRQGRLGRLRQLAGLGARVGGNLLRARLGGDEAALEALTQQAAERMVKTLGEMKGLALKAGQSLSMVADHLPPEARQVLGQLFSQAPTLPFADIEAVMREQLGQPLDTIFAHIEPTPLAAASLAQVHGAQLRSGERVVIKVQYPHVAEALQSDLRNVGALGALSQLGGSLLDGRAYVEEMIRELTRELDYTQEAQSLQDYQAAVADFPGLVVPRNHAAYTRPKLLVLERLEGMTLQAYCQDVDTHPEAERTALAENLMRAVCLPFVRHGLVHGDAHPGNFMVLPDGRLGVLDFGCVKRVSENYRRCSVAMLAALEAEDWPRMLEQARLGGFVIDLPDAKALPLLKEAAQLTIGFFTGPYNWEEDNTMHRLMALKRHSPLTLARMRPPPEAMLVYRALMGVGYNLRHLHVKCDFSPLVRQILS